MPKTFSTVTVAVNMVQNTSEVHARSTCYRYGGKLNGRDSQLVYAINVAKKAICPRFVAVPRSLAPRALRGKGPAAAVQQVKQPPTEEEKIYTLFTLSEKVSELH